MSSARCSPDACCLALEHTGAQRTDDIVFCGKCRHYFCAGCRKAFFRRGLAAVKDLVGRYGCPGHPR